MLRSNLLVYGIRVFPSADRFIGLILCRDTVCSVGLVPHTLPFTRSNTAIRYFRHAIALDERRAKFKANHYHLNHEDDQKGTKVGEMPRSNHRHPHFDSGHHRKYGQKRYSKKHNGETDVLEVWFAGCHCGMCNRLGAALPY
jgi:uncharacterized protein (DUF2235 family)